MARLLAVDPFLNLVLAPAVSAEPQTKESPLAGWLDAFWSDLGCLSSWTPTIRSESRKSGAILIPTGVTQPPPSGLALCSP